MPSIVAVVAGALAGGAAAAIAGTSLLTGALIGGALAGAQALLAPKPPKFNAAFDADIGRVDTRGEVVAAVEGARWILGRARTAGSLKFYEETNDGEDAWLGLALSEGPCVEIEKIWVDSEPVSFTRSGNKLTLGGGFDGKLTVYQYFAANGTQGAEIRTACSGFSTEHLWRGLSWVALHFHQPEYKDADGRFWAKRPTVEFLVKGLKFTWPGQTTEAWTENAAAIRYWVERNRGGLPAVAIDETAFASAFAVCNGSVSLSTSATGYTGTSIRYRANGIINSEMALDAIRTELDWCWQGNAVESGGILYFRPGADRAAAAALGPDDFLDVSQVKPAPALQERINALTMTLASSQDHDWLEYDVPETVDNPALARDENFYLPQDTGSRRFVVGPIDAQRLQTISLRRARGSLSMQAIIKPGDALEKFGLIPSDRVTVTLDEFGFDGFLCEISRITVRDDYALVLNLEEVAVGAYADTLVIPPIHPRDISIPGARTVPAVTGLTADEIAVVQTDGTVVVSLVVDWTLAPVFQTEIEIRQTGETDLLDTITSITTQARWPGVAVGESYDYRARHLARDGYAGAWTTWGTRIIGGDLTAPANPANLAFSAVAGGYRLEWDAPTEGDFSHTLIYQGTTATFMDAVQIGRVSSDFYERTGFSDITRVFLWVRHLDRSGNQSATATVNGSTGAVANIEISGDNQTLVELITSLINSNSSIGALNTAVANAQQAEQNAAASALGAEAAKTAAETAQAAAETAEAAAELAETAAETALTATQTARDTAQTAANDAEAQAVLAGDSASSASGSATAAAGSASTASDEADAADGSASAAATSASAAAASATAAGRSATAAASSASTASTQATNAGSEASAARTDRVKAETAKDAAETAEAAAETAQAAAESAQTSAVSAKNDAESAEAAAATSETNAAASESAAGNSASAASTSASTAASEASDAASSASAADTSATAAETAQAAAETAEAAASTSETNADGSARAAAASLTSVQASASAAETAKDDAETAKDDAETAETNAEASATAAASSAQTAEASEDAAGSSASAASSAQTAAETAQAAAETAEANAASSATAADGSAQAAATSARGIVASVNAAKGSADAAATSATAAASSASAAEASKDTAGTSAMAAANSATSAQTAAATAGTAAQNAATSQTAADGSATAAATSAMAAAASAQQAAGAGGSATAAATSAQQAEASAMGAATSAAAAVTSAAAAETAKAAAEASSTAAAAAVQTAQGYASSAQISQTAAAGSATQAQLAVAGITSTVAVEIDNYLQTTLASIVTLRAVAGEAKAKFELVALSDASGSRSAGVITGDFQSFDYAPAGGTIAGAFSRASVAGFEFQARAVGDGNNAHVVRIEKARDQNDQQPNNPIAVALSDDLTLVTLTDNEFDNEVSFDRADIVTAINNTADVLIRASGEGLWDVDYTATRDILVNQRLSGGRDNVETEDGQGYILRRDGTAELDAASIRGTLSAAHIASDVQNFTELRNSRWIITAARTSITLPDITRFHDLLFSVTYFTGSARWWGPSFSIPINSIPISTTPSLSVSLRDDHWQQLSRSGNTIYMRTTAGHQMHVERIWGINYPTS